MSTTLVSAIAMIAAIGTMVLVVLALTQDKVESALNDRFDAVSATLVQGKDGSISELETSSDAIQDSAWVFDLPGKQVVGPAAGKNVTRAVKSLSRVTKRTNLHRGEHLYLASPVKDEETGKTMAVVVVTESFEPYEATQTITIVGLIVLGIAVTAGTGALAAWTVGRTLDPVNSMASRAEEWSDRDLESRFDVGTTEDEIAHLGSTLNLLLDRVATTIRGEQRLTSELAHELRTPLTAIRGEAELGLMAIGDPHAQDRLGRIVASVDRLSGIITTLVAIARGHEGSGSRANVAAVLGTILDDRQLPSTTTVDLAGVDARLEVAAPAELAERALAPLIDNAVKYAKSSVTVSTEVRGRSVVVTVSDNGPGVEFGDLDDVFRAGARSDASTGAGLGLALSRRVARTLGGDIGLLSPADPTTFTLEIPRH
ncbi:MAG: HAMP domain-containing histidine kinase [Actinomycetota bacterium]|nr:HAMP domain-containing histidine kinase [Actinomycetota bacterium]